MDCWQGQSWRSVERVGFEPDLGLILGSAPCGSIAPKGTIR